MTLGDLHGAILTALYEAHFASPTGTGVTGLNQLAAERQLPTDGVWKAFGVLREGALAEDVAMGGLVRITSWGILAAEEQGLAPAGAVERNVATRKAVLEALADVYERSGDWAAEDWRALAQEHDIGEDAFLQNLRLLEDTGLIRGVTLREIQITLAGLDQVAQHRRRATLKDRYDALPQMDPQQRGLELEKLLEDLFSFGDWQVERDVRPAGEQVDLIIHREREYYLVEAKWEKDPVEPGRIREFSARLRERPPGTRGLFISMSSYTDEAVKAAQRVLPECLLLFLSRGDIEAILEGQASFDQVLDQKFEMAIKRREIIVEVAG